MKISFKLQHVRPRTLRDNPEPAAAELRLRIACVWGIGHSEFQMFSIGPNLLIEEGGTFDVGRQQPWDSAPKRRRSLLNFGRASGPRQTAPGAGRGRQERRGRALGAVAAGAVVGLGAAEICLLGSDGPRRYHGGRSSEGDPAPGHHCQGSAEPNGGLGMDAPIGLKMKKAPMREPLVVARGEDARAGAAADAADPRF